MAFRSSTSTTPGSGTSVAPAVPSGAAAGDIAVVGVYLESAATITPPAGFTLKSDLATSPTARGRLAVYWKRLTAADTGTYSFTWSGSAFAGSACGLWSGRVTSGDPFDGTPGTAESAVAATTLNVSTTPTYGYGDSVGLWTNFAGGATWTPPTNYTERVDNDVITLDSRDSIVAGSTGNVSATTNLSGFLKGFIGTLLPAAPAFSNLTSGGASSATSFNTASVTPAGNQLILVSVHAYISTGSVAPSAPTVTGNGITYTLIGSGQDVDNAGTDRAKLFVYRGMAASPSAGAITISFGATTMTRCFWSVDQSSGNVDISGTNGSGAIVTDPPVGFTSSSTVTGTGDITYSPSMTAGSGAFAAIAHQTNEQITPRASWTELADTFPVTIGSLETQYLSGTDTAASGTWTTAARAGGIALEIKAAGSGGGITGTATVTQDSNTASASGQLGYSGTVAATQANQTAAASGTNTPPGISGTASVTQANQTAAATGSLGYTGTVARTQAANTASASGTVTTSGFTGSIAAVQASQTAAAAGVLSYSGTVSVLQAANTAAASGVLGYTGTLARVQANQTSTASGLVAIPITGSVAVVQANQVSTASGVNQPLVSFGSSSAGVGIVPSSQPGNGSVPDSTPATVLTPSASAGTGGVPTSTGA